MTYVAEHGVPGVRLTPRPRRPARRAPVPPRCRDSRWPQVAAALAALRADKRCSVRIVDADCGAGTLLLCAVRFARALGFTAIEARGVTAAPALIGRARAAAATLHDPAVGITFEQGVPGTVQDEVDFPADIVLWHGCQRCDDRAARRATERALASAGRALIADQPRPRA
ncbi:hypothetical protein [Sphingomonas sp. PAMC 26605]|uniref:hypothetical protein n=1 Tax=Sphingomonas sp. PAMC 26605 TaxID=1112214 RepID=UPI00026CABB6|nr:hypothetical protein [Sphingomonas sp. PAMC 26605]